MVGCRRLRERDKPGAEISKRIIALHRIASLACEKHSTGELNENTH